MIHDDPEPRHHKATRNHGNHGTTGPQQPRHHKATRNHGNHGTTGARQRWEPRRHKRTTGTTGPRDHSNHGTTRNHGNHGTTGPQQPRNHKEPREPRDHDHKNATSHGTTHGTAVRALAPPRRDITTHGTTVRGGRRRDARNDRWRGALCCVALRVARAQCARARGERERRQWLRGAAVGHVPLPRRGGRALARAVVERLADASHKATSCCSSCCRRRRSTRPMTMRRPPPASSCAG